jgi:hypothetical protein
MRDLDIKAAMFEIDKILKTHGVEYAAHKNDTYRNAYGLLYCNTGDTYAMTVIWDHKRQNYCVSSIGDIVEKAMSSYP